MDRKRMIKRILMSFFGVIISGIAIGFLKKGAFGVDPWQSMLAGLDLLLPIDFGTMYVIVGLVMLVVIFLINRHYIGFGTFVTMLLQGYVIQFVRDTLFRLIPGEGIPVRVFCFAFGFVLLCFATAFYFTADLGLSVYDAVSMTMAYKWHILSFRLDRILTDVFCVIAACIMYVISGEELSGLLAIVGVGTVLTAFCMGPLIDFFNRKAAIPFLNGTKNGAQAE